MSMSKSMARVAIGALAGAALVAAVPAGQAFAANQPANWVSYGTVPAGATVQTVQGRSDGHGACTFNLSSSLAPGQVSARVDDVAFSSTTCQSRVALTSGAASAPEPAERSDASSTGSGLVASPLAGSRVAPRTRPAAALLTRHSAGFMKSWFQDPIGLTVNSVQNSTDWNWNGGCVTAPVFGSYNYYWFSPSGWVLRENNWNNSYNCSLSTSSSYVHYHNGIFCAFISTESYYNRNTVNGRFDGWLLGSFSWTLSGGCIGLLSFHDSLRRTLN
jgi:hypothetical protein